MATNANYVRFIRGTPTAWANLKVKDDDCLYFIAEKNSNAGYLYLGDKLISGSGGGGSGVDASILGRIERLEKKQDLDTNHLKDLQDVTLGSKIADGSSLVYNATTKKWTNKVLSSPYTDCSNFSNLSAPSPPSNEVPFLIIQFAIFSIVLYSSGTFLPKIF